MTIGKISGVMLQSDLVRQGQDLAFDTDLVYLDVVNRRLGVNNTNASNTVSVTGNVNAHYYFGVIGTGDQYLITNVGTLGNLTVSGNLVAGNLYGNINGNISGNITVPGANTQVVFNDSGILGASSGFTFDKAANVVVISGNANIGNLTTINGISVTGTVISTVNANANIYLSPTGSNSIVQLTGTRAFSMPAGTTAQEPTDVPAGSLRYNTDIVSPEYFNGNNWISLTTAVGYQTFSGNGTGNTFPLNQSTTTGGVLVSLNGVQQTPNVAYTVSGTSITFTETPETSDVIDVRYISSGQELAISLQPDFTEAVTISNTLSVSGNTTVSALTVNNSATIGTTLGVTGNAIVGNLNSSGNINGSYIFGNGSQLTAVTAVTAQYVTQATQSNITAVGTLTNLVVNNSITVSNAVSYSPTVIYINATDTVIDSFTNTAARSVKYIVQTSDSANVKYQVDEILLCQDGNISTIAVYGTVSTNGNIVGFSSNVVGSTVRLYAQSTGANCAIKATKLTIAV